MGDSVPVCQTVPEFAAAGDDEVVSNNNRKSKTCKAPVRSPPPADIQFFTCQVSFLLSDQQFQITGGTVLVQHKS